jgi:ATP-binding cassette subfamily B protein
VRHRFYDFTRTWYRREVKAAMMMNIVFNTSLIMFSMGNAIGLVIGAWLYQAGEMTIGTVYLLFHYTNMLVQPVEHITNQLGDLQKAGASIGRINAILEERPTILDGRGDPLSEGPLSVSVENVTFGYNPEEPVIEEMSFKLEAGKILGVLGRTGGGKTTIGRLLLRLYDPGTGTIKVGDTDLKNLTLHELRDRVAIVTQNVQMFQATVRDNLTLFDPDIHDEKLLSVIDSLGLRDWIEGLADGLDTMISSGGSGLSAGQGQLIAFARILLVKSPDLVILYEASSRLDPATELLVERSVSRLLEGRTAIIIAHRLGTVQRADEILILDKGRILEHGDRRVLAANPESRFHHLLETGLEIERSGSEHDPVLGDGP